MPTTPLYKWHESAGWVSIDVIIHHIALSSIDITSTISQTLSSNASCVSSTPLLLGFKSCWISFSRKILFNSFYSSRLSSVAAMGWSSSPYSREDVGFAQIICCSNRVFCEGELLSIPVPSWPVWHCWHQGKLSYCWWGWSAFFYGQGKCMPLCHEVINGIPVGD